MMGMMSLLMSLLILYINLNLKAKILCATPSKIN
jgi:hypothetical protein